MSLVVAKKSGEAIIIVGDTKFTNDDASSEDARRIKWFPAEDYIKSVIITQQICISFAGEEKQAESFYKTINEHDSLEHMLTIALKFNINSGFAVEFIVAQSAPSKLFFVKNGVISEADYGYIGLRSAYEVFEKFMQDGIPAKDNLTYFTIEVVMPDYISKDMQRIPDCMDGVIDDESLTKVGGFKVTVLTENGKFIYWGYIKTYQRPLDLSLMPKGYSVIDHANASEGGYTIVFFQFGENCKLVSIHIKQGDFGIVYNRKYGGLLIPDLVKNIDEVEFCDYVLENYNQSPKSVTMSKEDKYFNLGVSELHKNENRKAIAYFKKGLQPLTGSRKGNLWFYKGVAELKLNDNEALKSFQEAIFIDSRFQSKIIQILRKAGKL